MYKKLKRIIASLLTLVILISPFFLIIACNNKKNNVFNFDNKISLVSNMPETWPQYNALKLIVKNYNKYERNRKNFMEVIFLSEKDVKTKNLNNKINKLILSKSNDVPNILLDRDFGQIYQLATFNKLLNLKSTSLNVDIFNKYFVKGLSSFTIKNYKKRGLYAVPTLVVANNSIVINKPVLKKIFNLMKKHGAIIENDKINPIIQAIMNNQTILTNKKNLLNGKYDNKRNVQTPQNLWVDNGQTNSQKLNGYKINDAIFKTYQKFYEFIEKAHNSLKLNNPLYIYGSGVLYDFLTLLDSQQKTTSEEHSLFNKNEDGTYNFPILKNKKAKAKIATAFNKLIKLAKANYGDYPENNNIVGLRNGQHGITSHFSVSARYSYKSNVFGDYTNNGFAFNDILYLPSPNKWSQESSYNSRQLSRWLLMGIKTNEIKDKAVKTFIDYLYNGHLKEDIHEFKNKPRKVVDFLQWESSYGIPLKNNFDFEKQYLNIYSKFKRKDNKYNAIYRGLKNIQDSMKNPKSLKNFDGNQYTSNLLNIIKRIIINSLKNPKQWNGTRFVKEILKNKSDFEY